MLKIISLVSFFSVLFLFHATSSQAALFEVRRFGFGLVIVEEDSEGRHRQYEIDGQLMKKDRIFELVSELNFTRLKKLEEVRVREKLSSVMDENQLLKLLESRDHTLIINEEPLSKGNSPKKTPESKKTSREDPGTRKVIFTEDRKPVPTGTQNHDTPIEHWADGFCFDSPANFDAINQMFVSLENINQALALHDQSTRTFDGNEAPPVVVDRLVGPNASTDNKSIENEDTFAEKKNLLYRYFVDKGLDGESRDFPDLHGYLNVSHREIAKMVDRVNFQNTLVKWVKKNFDSLEKLAGQEAIISAVLKKARVGLMLERKALLIEGQLARKKLAIQRKQEAEDPNIQNLKSNLTDVRTQLGQSKINLDDEELKSLLELSEIDKFRIKARDELTKRFIEIIANFNNNSGLSVLENLKNEKQTFLKRRASQMKKHYRKCYEMKMKQLAENKEELINKTPVNEVNSESSPSNFDENQLLNLLENINHTLIINEELLSKGNSPKQTPESKKTSRVHPEIRKFIFTEDKKLVPTGTQNHDSPIEHWAEDFSFDSPDFEAINQMFIPIINIDQALALHDQSTRIDQEVPHQNQKIKGIPLRKNVTSETAVSRSPKNNEEPLIVIDHGFEDLEGLNLDKLQAFDERDSAEKVNLLFNYLVGCYGVTTTDKQELYKLIILSEVVDLKERIDMRYSIVESFNCKAPGNKPPAWGELNSNNVYDSIRAKRRLYLPEDERVNEVHRRMEVENETQLDLNGDQDKLNLKKNIKKLSTFLKTKKGLLSGVPLLEKFLKCGVEIKKAEDRPSFRDDLVKTLIEKLSALSPAPNVDQTYDVSNLFKTTKEALLNKRVALKQEAYSSAQSYQRRLPPVDHEGNPAATQADIIPDDIHLNDNKNLLSKSLGDKGLKSDSPGFPDLNNYLKLYPAVKNVEERQEFRSDLVNAVRKKLDSLNNLSGDELKTRVLEVLVEVKKGLIEMRTALQDERKYLRKRQQTPSDVENFNLNRTRVLAQLSESEVVLEDADLASLLNFNRYDVPTYEDRIETRNDLTGRFVESIARFDKNNGESLLEILKTNKQSFLNERTERMTQLNKERKKLNQKKRKAEKEAKLTNNTLETKRNNGASPSQE